MGTRTTLFKLTILFTLILGFTVSPARAAFQANDRAVFLSQYTALALITDFEHYRSGRGKPGLYENLMQQLSDFRDHFDHLLAGDKLPPDTKQQLKSQWQQAARNLGACLVTVKQGGFIDQEISYQYQEQMQLFWDNLYSLPLSAPNTREQRWMELVLVLQQTNLRYLNPAWELAPYQGSPIAGLVPAIDSLILATGEIQPQLQEKWPVLKQALENENRAMGFIVNRYSSDMVTLLLHQLDPTRFQY